MSRKVVVVGGGYGGVAVASALDAGDPATGADVFLVDPSDAFVNSAASLRALVQPDFAGNLCFPYRQMFTRATVIRDRAASVDPGGVTLASGRRVAADYLVLATGSSYAYPGKPRAESARALRHDLLRTHQELAGADRVLIAGAGPVGLELAGEISTVWPDKRVTIVDPARQLLPGFRPELRQDLERQLAERKIELRLGTGLAAAPAAVAGQAATVTVTTTGGAEITADIWFRAHGVRINSGYLADRRLTAPTPSGQVRVTRHLQVEGYDHVYAIGDLTDVAEAKMAGYAMQHAEVVASNITAQLGGEPPSATYRPAPEPMILLPLGPQGGVGQLPTPDGPEVVPVETVVAYKGADLFTGRFAAMFGAPS